jgi:2-amino-4-hydroxy-6-hydroxymethyldihydropteridine diphosphokinase
VGPRESRRAIHSPILGQSLAERMAATMNATNPSSPNVTPSTMSLFLARFGAGGNLSRSGTPARGYALEPMLDAVVGLGSNLGDRRATLSAAARELETFGRVVARSALYETDPVGPPQPRYLNAAVLFQTHLTAEPLLEALLAVEAKLGRIRRERWGPRVIDLDILWVDGESVRTPALTVPHPSLRERPFALRPLLDVAPSARDPNDGTAYAAVLTSLDATGVLEMPASRASW